MEIIKNAIDNIKTNKLKVGVAMIWIVLGITSVVVVSSIGNGLEKQGQSNLEDEKFRKKTVMFYPNYESSVNPELFEPFTQEDIDKISIMKGVERVTPNYGQSQGIYYGGGIEKEGKHESASFKVVEKPIDIKLAHGRTFSLDDLDRKTVILQYDIARRLFNENAGLSIGQSVQIHGELFEVIGVLKEQESGVVDKNDNYLESIAYLPEKALNEISRQQSFGQPISELEVLMAKGVDTSEVGYEIQKMFEKSKSEEEGSYSVNDTEDASMELYYMQNTINRFTTILAKVALFIGGIGIMNIMYMAVAERQREIGIKRAIGAQPKDILIQFVIETVVITIIGGIIGAVVGTIAAHRVGVYYLNIPAAPDIMVYLNAIYVSVLTGVIFGSIPAYKASKLDPIKAIQG